MVGPVGAALSLDESSGAIRESPRLIGGVTGRSSVPIEEKDRYQHPPRTPQRHTPPPANRPPQVVTVVGSSASPRARRRCRICPIRTSSYPTAGLRPPHDLVGVVADNLPATLGPPPLTAT
ncbi:hypothetical protein TIFTF001_014048 [Ficus carica]|uniref:Uncharacterized protein n=1 Tax=Ficus carica TaxID=3494 RepID=A0AA88AQQ9_FICCA|nr:hypothetical protein TIFTF001_014048 [Ficus carica]